VNPYDLIGQAGEAMRREHETELIQSIGRWVMADTPQGWQRIDLLVRVGVTHRLAIIVDDTNKLEGQPAPEVSPLLVELVEVMDDSWNRFRLIIDPPDDYRAWFMHDDHVDELPQEKRIAQELLFTLPPGWDNAQVRARSAVVRSITGFTYAWTPPEGLVPEGAQMNMKHPFEYELTS
jgi:hypothetical protein